MDATGERELAGKAEVLKVVVFRLVQRRVQAGNRQPRKGLERRLAFRRSRQGGLDDLRVPLLMLSGNVFKPIAFLLGHLETPDRVWITLVCIRQRGDYTTQFLAYPASVAGSRRPTG